METPKDKPTIMIVPQDNNKFNIEFYHREGSSGIDFIEDFIEDVSIEQAETIIRHFFQTGHFKHRCNCGRCDVDRTNSMLKAAKTQQ